MATEKEMYELIGRMVTDADFRKKMAADPGKAANNAGYALTDKQQEAFKSMDEEGLAAVLDERFPKSIGLAEL